MVETRKLDMNAISKASFPVNPSLIRFNAKLLMAYAGVDLNPRQQRIFITEMNDSFTPKGPQIEVTDLEPPNQARDPRLLVFRNQLLCAYTDDKDQWLAQLNHDFEVVRNIKLRYAASQGREKNWQFFEHSEQLHAVYSVSPHVVLRIDLNTGDTEEVARTEQSMIWGWGLLHGGGPAVLNNGEWYCFPHSYLISRRRKLRFYAAGCYTFESTPPFRVLRYTSRPLLLGDTKDLSGINKVAAVFPAGAVLDGSDWKISYGYNDLNCRLATISTEELERRLDRKPSKNLGRLYNAVFTKLAKLRSLYI